MPEDILPGCAAESPIPDYMGPLSQSASVLSAAQSAIRQTVTNGLAGSQQVLDGVRAMIRAELAANLTQSVNVLDAVKQEAEGTVQSRLAGSLTTAQEMGVQPPTPTRYVNHSGLTELAINTGQLGEDGVGQWVMPDGTNEIASIDDIVSRGMLCISQGPVDLTCDQAYGPDCYATGSGQSYFGVYFDPHATDTHLRTYHTSGSFHFSKAQADTHYIRLSGSCATDPGECVPGKPPVTPPVVSPWDPPVLPPINPPVVPPVGPPPVEPPVVPPGQPCPPPVVQCPAPVVQCPAPVVHVTIADPRYPQPPDAYQPPVEPPVVPPVEPPVEPPKPVPKEKSACPDDPDYHIAVCQHWTPGDLDGLIPGLLGAMALGQSADQMLAFLTAINPDEVIVTY